MNSTNPIILIGPAFPLRGGIAHFNESFAYSLVDAGYPVELVSFYLQYPSVLFPGKSQKSDGPAPANLKIHNWLSSVNPLSWSKAAKKIVKLKPRLVVIRFWIPFMGPALGAVARKLRKKGIHVIGLVDNAIPHESRGLDTTLSKLFFNNCSAFFTLSESVANDLKQLAPGKKVETSPHPVYDIFGDTIPMSLARQNLGLSQDQKYVLFFGFIRAYKGLDLLLQAFADKAIQNIKLIVAGEFYEDEQKYLNLINELGLKDTVIIRSDYIPQEEVKNYFCAANLVAQTYKTATQSGVTQIAYHFERPMLVTNVGGLAEIVPDGKVGYVVEPNPGAIASAIARFFSENRESAFAENAAIEKERFLWSHFTRKFMTFAEDII